MESKESYSSFMQKLEQIKSKITEKISEPENGREPIYDGPINPEKYFNSKVKVAWLLKEGYCDKDGTGGDWSYTDVYDKENLYESLIKHISSKATWFPVVYVTYAILNGHKCYDDMDYIKDDPSMVQVMREIAVVNAQKLPARQHTSTDLGDIVESISKYGDFIKEQVDILNPDILIGASTMKLYTDLFELNPEDRKTFGSVNYWIKQGKLYVDAYHPNQRSIDRTTYVDDILRVVEEYFNARRN
jgi:hypothetical protein